MEANVFIAKLKADGSSKDLTDLKEVYNIYKSILAKLSAKDRGSFSLNALCIICRNLDKAPKWRDTVDNTELLILSIDCLRETRGLERPDRVKTLACIYHIHKHIIRQNTPIPPELVLKISYMPFEVDSKDLLHEYCKTYWNILVDRLCYVERLKTKVVIGKLLPKLAEDILNTIIIYNTVQFCSTLLQFLVKKLHFLYNDSNPKELNQIFLQIFQKLTTKQDVNDVKTLTESQTLDLFVKLNDCLYVIAENASKVNFKDSPLNIIVRDCTTMMGHRPDLFHCLQTFYTNGFCSLFAQQDNFTYNESVLNNMMFSFEITEKLGYKKAMYVTYPYLNQFLRLYIESVNCGAKPLEERIGDGCMKMILILMEKLRNCEQLVKCENCKVKSGLHDALRLSLLVKNFICTSRDMKNVLPSYFDVITKQYMILNDLNDSGCRNHHKYFRKLQTDLHNSAIVLNKAHFYSESIKLFDIYLKHETQHEVELRNISRALYNKSICEMDFKLYEEALTDAFLSLVFSQEGLSMDKYLSLVMDIKAKHMKTMKDNESNDNEGGKVEEFQMTSVLDVCKVTLENYVYKNLHGTICNLKFSELLRHEFSMYAKLWPSVLPIAGVWKALYDLLSGKQHQRLTGDDENEVLWTLFEIVLETPTVVRSIQNEYYSRIVSELLERLEGTSMTSPDLKVVHASLLFLKTEYDLNEASEKYGWKIADTTLDPDLVQAIRTIPQEHAATRGAIRAVDVLTDLLANMDKVSRVTILRHSLDIAQVFVQQLLYVSRSAHALQLAHICCQMAKRLGNWQAYIRNAGTLLYHMSTCSEELLDIITPAGGHWSSLIKSADTLETAVTFVCDAAIYFGKSGFVASSAKLVELAQARILSAYETIPNINLDLAVGRLMEAQTLLCKDSGPSTLSSVNGIQRHYLSIPNTATRWSARRLVSLTLKSHAAGSCLAAAGGGARVARCRARAGACAGMRAAAAHALARLHAAVTCTHHTDEAQTKIDNRLKHILGLQPSNETQPYCNHTESTTKHPQFTPKADVETMLEGFVFKKTQTSPSVPCASVPGFKMPDFYAHAAGCRCYGCGAPDTCIVACQAAGLEAAVHHRAKEFDIAKNYYSGVLKMFSLTEQKLKCATEMYKEMNFERYIVENVERMHWSAFRTVQLQILIEISFFELGNGNFDMANDYVVRIHEVMQGMDDVDRYMSNEVMNLMTASAQLRKSSRRPGDVGLEAEFESLKLSPVKFAEPPTTPVTKQAPPRGAKVVVKDDEVPKKRKVIKLNLDDGSPEAQDVRKSVKKSEFKVPVPVTSKPVLEVATPRPTRSKPNILVSVPSDDVSTPKSQMKTDFFTPADSTPEQFFTPMTSLKTYSKKTLRRGIVKSLEQEFSTPKTDKENSSLLPETRVNVPSKSRAKESGKNTLKRATSPGKLCKETNTATTRSRRLRKPVSFSIEDK